MEFTLRVTQRERDSHIALIPSRKPRFSIVLGISLYVIAEYYGKNRAFEYSRNRSQAPILFFVRRERKLLGDVTMIQAGIVIMRSFFRERAFPSRVVSSP